MIMEVGKPYDPLSVNWEIRKASGTTQEEVICLRRRCKSKSQRPENQEL